MFSIGSKKIPCISVAMDAIKYVVTLLIPIVTVSLCSAQQSRINGQQKVVLPATHIRFDSLLSIVSRQTGAKFSLNTSKFPPSRLIHVPKGPMPLTQLLAAIRDDTGIYYTALGGHIIFIDNPPRKSQPLPAKKSVSSKETKEKSTSEKLLLKKLSANKVATPAITKVSWNLQAIPTIYFVPDTLQTSGTAMLADSGNITVASGSKQDTIKKEDSLKRRFAAIDTIKKTDSLNIAFKRGATKTTMPHFIYESAPKDVARRQLLRFSSWQPDPSLQWGWGRKKDDTLLHKIVAVGGTDSTNKEQQAATITKDNLLAVATNSKTQQSETATVTTSPDEKLKAASSATTKTSLVKSIFQNTFSNKYQKPGAQGVRGSNVQGPFSFLLNTGVTADEVYYANPTVQIGLPFLYGIASVSTNFNLVGFRAGAGIALRLSGDWRLHFQGTIGKQPQYFDFSDTIGVTKSGTANSQLLKFSLVGEKRLGEHFRLQAGIVLNNQRVRYTANDGVALSAAQMDKAYEQMSIIHAPYTITNYYGYGQQTKTWIGFQVGIFYNINFNKRE